MPGEFWFIYLKFVTAKDILVFAKVSVVGFFVERTVFMASFGMDERNFFSSFAVDYHP